MSSVSLESLLGKEHPEIKYLKNPNISLVLSRAIAECYKHKPNDPVSFFANHLLNHCNVQRQHHDNYARHGEVAKSRDEHLQKEREDLISQEAVKQQKKEVEEKKESFFTAIKDSSDLTDNLQQLTDFLSENTKATGVYVSKLVYPRKQIDDGSDDKAHLDEDAPKVLEYVNATADHKFMLDRTLGPDQGITHDVFKEPSAGGEDAGEEEEGAETQKKETDILTSFKGVVYVKEVVREPRMRYQKVPKLGCYMAVPLVYQSCLSDEALDALMVDTQERMAKQTEQDAERDAYEQEVQGRREAAEAEGAPFEEEEKEWPVIEEAPLITHEVKYVVSLDTMGQDRGLDDDTKRFILRTVQAFQTAWEESDRRALYADRDKKLQLLAVDQNADAEVQQNINEEIEKEVEETMNSYEEGHFPDDEAKELESQTVRLHAQGKAFSTRQEWIDQMKEIASYRVLKMPRILQALMYLLGMSREEICEPNTNLFDWKRAKPVFESKVPDCMAEYQLLGAKFAEYRDFNKLNYVDSLLAGLEQEAVEAHNQAFGKLFKWLTTAIATRKADVTRRHALTKKAREERQQRITEAEQRETLKAEKMAEEEEKFKADHKEEIEAYDKWMEEQAQRESQDYGEELDEEEEARIAAGPPPLPTFDAEEAIGRFDEEVPAIVIPDEVHEDTDNDWALDEDQITEIINAYWAARGEA